MGSVVGYMLTWTTYGTWLQGDARGYVKDGKTFKGNPALLRANKESQQYETVRLDGQQKDIVRDAILEESECMGQKILALSVWSTHVHLVVENINEPVGVVAGRYKRAATCALQVDGFEGKVWTKGYDKRYCFDEASLKARVDYVNGHGE
jgi:hypothetical protein